MLLFGASTSTYGQAPLFTDIEVFAASDPSINLDRTDAWHVDNAIDGDLATRSWLTPINNAREAVVALDLATPTLVTGLRVNKFQSDTENNGGTDSMNLQVLVSADTGPLHARTFVPVTGMVNGHLGAEPIHANAVNADGSIVGDVHDPQDGLFWAVSFDAVEITTIAMRFDKISGPGGYYVHYPVGEFQPLTPSTGAGPRDGDQVRALGVDGNPLHGRGTLSFGLSRPGVVRVEVFDVQGRRVRLLLVGAREAGLWTCDWDGRDDHGGHVSSAVYVCRLAVNGAVAGQRKLLFIR